MKTAKHPKLVFRVSRDNPWAIRPPRGDNRFDICDPDTPVMTLYTGESAESALAEVLAQFRPSLDTIAAVNSIPADDQRVPAAGIVTSHWLQTRQMGRAKLKQTASIVDITHPETIQSLRNQPTLASQAIESGFADLDDSALKNSGPDGRRFTQTTAALIYNLGHTGIRYGSRLGSTFHCIAGFVSLNNTIIAPSDFLSELMPTRPISADERALREVMRIFNLKQ